MNATINPEPEQPRLAHVAGQRELVIREVLEVANRIESDRLAPVASRQAGIASQPLSLLGLVTYHYAVGILPSREIEQELWINAPFRAVCGFEFPDRRLIRRFRRLNRRVIHDCLEQALRCTAQALRATGIHRMTSFVEPDFSAEAETRITNAILLDNEEDEE